MKFLTRKNRQAKANTYLHTNLCYLAMGAITMGTISVSAATISLSVDAIPMAPLAAGTVTAS